MLWYNCKDVRDPQSVHRTEGKVYCVEDSTSCSHEQFAHVIFLAINDVPMPPVSLLGPKVSSSRDDLNAVRQPCRL